jgi:uncharacterized protein YkwD
MVALLGLSAGIAQATDYKPFINHSMSGTKGSWNYRVPSGQVYSYIYFDIGTDCASFTLDTGYDGHGGTGDCDLYLGLGYKPTTTSYLRRSRNTGYKERIQVLNPPAGRYYVKLFAVSNYKTCFRLSKTIQIPAHWRTDMLNRVNYERRSRGLVALVTESRLKASSQNYANDMAAKHYYGGSNHVGSTYANYTFPRRLTAAGYTSYWRARENIAYGYTTVASVMRAWMNSPGHRASLLKPGMRHAGFGLADGHDRYGFRWVQVFVDPL